MPLELLRFVSIPSHYHSNLSSHAAATKEKKLPALDKVKNVPYARTGPQSHIMPSCPHQPSHLIESYFLLDNPRTPRECKNFGLRIINHYIAMPSSE